MNRIMKEDMLGLREFWQGKEPHLTLMMQNESCTFGREIQTSSFWSFLQVPSTHMKLKAKTFL